ncbi:MAG: hypothetical protein ABIZ52_07135 [Candidatus Limnocylindrales bacterium]
MVDVLPDAVSQRLRDAYYGAGGAIEVCVAAATVVCTRTTSIAQTARHFDDITRSIDAVELAALTAVHVPVGRIIVAGDFGPVDGAAFARIAAGGPVDGRLLMAVNPGRRGIDYLILVSSGSART